jgi:hypothetical protein
VCNRTCWKGVRVRSRAYTPPDGESVKVCSPAFRRKLVAPLTLNYELPHDGRTTSINLPNEQTRSIKNVVTDPQGHDRSSPPTGFHGSIAEVNDPGSALEDRPD